jgi:hypothetical protein
MSWWQSFALSLLGVALAGLTAAIKNPDSRAKYRAACLEVVLAANVIKAAFPTDPDFQ